MKIVLIGAGNLATNLGYALQQAGHTITQVYSRTEASAASLASLLHTPFTTSVSDVVREADVFLVSVTDTALPHIADEVLRGREGQFIVHTAGTMPMDTVHARRRGVLYPMQTFSKQRLVNFHDIPIFVETSETDDREKLQSLAESISERVYEVSSQDRKYIHLAAVFCCNFANHCYAMGEKLLTEHGVPFSVMLPLIEETAAKVRVMSPVSAQTGPAVRRDSNVMEAHMRLLADNPACQTLYQLMSEGIIRLSK